MFGFRLTADLITKSPQVFAVTANSPAAIAGLKTGDTIARINGASVPDLAAAREVLSRALTLQQPIDLTLASGRVVNIPAVSPPERSWPVHPAQVYSAITAGVLGWFLWAYYPYRRRDGEVFALLLTIYPVSRFLEEIIRTDEPDVFGTGLSISQNISLGLAVVVVGLWLYLSKQPRGVAWPERAAS
jgi:phosphatidylglycerol:prolipoprotein diacylglycerol transferase